MRVLLVATLLLAPLIGCGGSPRNRPALIGSLPADGASLTRPIAEIVLIYSEPVTLLNLGDARLRSGGVGIPLVPTLDPLDSTRVRLTPADGWSLVPESTNELTISQGLVINDESQYSLDEYIITFESAPARPIQLGTSGRVVALDPDTLQGISAVALPVGTDPRAMVTVELLGGPRTYVQLSSGSGFGSGVVWFHEGDLLTTDIALTTAGGDLLADAGAMAVGPRAKFIYAAFRDPDVAPSGAVRLVRVNAVTASESATLLLDSIPSNLAAMPLALVQDSERGLLYVVCADGATGRVAFVDEATFTELDQDAGTPGTQGVVLPIGAGPSVLANGELQIADPTSSSLTHLDPDDNSTSVSTANTVGTSSGLTRTADSRQVLQPLAGYQAFRAIQNRNRAAYGDNGFYVITDDVAGFPTGATSLRTLGPVNRQANGGRYLALLDSNVIALWIDDGSTFVQSDLDDSVDGIQCIPMPLLAIGAYVVGAQTGAFTP